MQVIKKKIARMLNPRSVLTLFRKFPRPNPFFRQYPPRHTFQICFRQSSHFLLIPLCKNDNYHNPPLPLYSNNLSRNGLPSLHISPKSTPTLTRHARPYLLPIPGLITSLDCMPHRINGVTSTGSSITPSVAIMYAK